MKTTKQFSIMMAIVLLSFSINSCRDQKILADNTITLYVDTDNINQDNIDSTCNFRQSADVSNEDFTTEVALGDNITWQGKAVKNGKVKIKKIEYVSGDYILTENELNNSLFSRKVHGKVVDEGTIGDIEKYLIEFKVKGHFALKR